MAKFLYYEDNRTLEDMNMIKKFTKEDIRLADWEYQYQQRGEQPISLSDFFCRSFSGHLMDALSGKKEACSYLFTDSDRGYNNPRELELILQLVKEKVQNKAAVQEILRNSIEVPKKFNDLADTIQRTITDTTLSNTELAEFWEMMDAEFIRVIPWFYYPWYISKENFLTDKVKEGLIKYQAEIQEICDVDEALLALVFPTKKTGFQLEQYDMLQLVESAQNDEDFPNNPHFKEQATIYLQKYDWLTTFILTPLRPMTYEQLVERVRNALKENFQTTFALQQESSLKSEARALQLVNLFSGDEELIRHIEDARELGYVLTAGIEEAYKSSARYLGFMELVAGRIGIAFEELKYLLSYEVSDALRREKTIDAEIIEERKKGFAMMILHGDYYVAFGDEGHAISQFIDTELNKVDIAVKELKGAVACKGFARGRVRIASQPSETRALVSGEILVCPMTNPDYVPAMRRAGAIVTDEGGLLCHAAIMSREFGKPCVIGTKIATQVLKDGDLVEVDANNGMVRIVEKAK